MVKTNNNQTMVQQLTSIITTQHMVLEPSAQHHIPAAQIQKEIQHTTKVTIEKEVTIPEDLPIKERIGKKGLMWPRTYAVNHPATPLLQTYTLNGYPVNCRESWTQDCIEVAIAHGPRQSARIPVARQVFRNETHNKVQQGFAKVIKYKDIAKTLPKGLKISPEACIPHKKENFE